MWLPKLDHKKDTASTWLFLRFEQLTLGGASHHDMRTLKQSCGEAHTKN